MKKPLADLEALTCIEELEEKVAPGTTVTVGPITIQPNTIVWDTL